MHQVRVSALRWVPPFAQGLVRDLRVRWALEEAGMPYEERLLGPEDQKSESYRQLQPFGQVPSFETEGLASYSRFPDVLLRLAELRLTSSEPCAEAAGTLSASFMSQLQSGRVTPSRT